MSGTKLSPKKILVVDDEPLVCDALKMMLTFDGHHVVAASSAHEALKLFDRGGFDVVITDYNMPEMKGDELTRALKARVPDQPVIMLSAKAETIRSQVEAMQGVDQLLGKPFQFADLRDAIIKVTAH